MPTRPLSVSQTPLTLKLEALLLVPRAYLNCSPTVGSSVLRQQIEKHIKICPFLKQAESLRLQPYYRKGINAGTCQDQEITTSLMKRNVVYQMTATQLLELINNIKSFHASICLDIQDSYKISQPCSTWLKTEADGKLPFQEKHVLQQASILGNMEDFGVLRNPANANELPRDGSGIPAVVEFGAGRGYLTQMLADCYGINKVFLVERRSYKLKCIINLQALPCLLNLLTHNHKKSIKKEACWTISNIIAGNKEQIQGFAAGLMLSISFLDLAHNAINSIGFLKGNLWFFAGVLFFGIIANFIPEPTLAPTVDVKGKKKNNDGGKDQLKKHCRQVLFSGIITAIGKSKVMKHQWYGRSCFTSMFFTRQIGTTGAQCPHSCFYMGQPLQSSNCILALASIFITFSSASSTSPGCTSTTSIQQTSLQSDLSSFMY